MPVARAENVVNITPRQIRRAFGSDVATAVAIIDQRSAMAAAILRRGFCGRLKWLLFGR